MAQAVNLGSVFATLELNTKNFKEGLNKAAGATSNFQKDLGKTGAALTKNVTLPLVALGTAGVAAFSSIEKAQKRIIIGTGVTGEAMEDMMSIVRRLAVRVPQGFEDVGIAVAEVNTRLGVTGQELEDLSRDMLDFARITGVDVATASRNVGRLFNALDLDSSDLEFTLSKLTYAAHETGIAQNDLINYIIDAGPAFEELGYGLDESIALFSQFEAAGARPEELISTLGMALNRMAEDGVPNAQEAFSSLLENIEDAPDVLAGTREAAEFFSARVRTKVVEDIQAGRTDIVGMVEDLQNVGGTFRDTADNSLTFTDELAMLKNEIVLLLEPLGKELVVVLREDIMPLLRTLIDFVSDLTQRFSELDDRTKKIIIIFAGVLAILGPTLVIISKVTVALGALFTAVKVVIGILSLKIIVIGLVIAAIGALVGLLIKSVGGIDNVKKAIETLVWTLGDCENRAHVLSPTLEKLGNVINNIQIFIQKTKEGIATLIWAYQDWEERSSHVHASVARIVGIIKPFIDAIQTAVWALGDWGERSDQVNSTIRKVIDTVIWFTNKITEVWDWINTLVWAMQDWDKRSDEVGITIRAVADSVRLFWKVLTDLWEIIKTNLLPALKNLFDSLGGLQPILDTIIKSAKLWAGILAGALLVSVLAIINALTVVIAVINGLIKILSFLMNVFSAVIRLFKEGTDKIAAAFGYMFDQAKATVENILAVFKWLYDKLVGNSIVPDMINAIAGLFGKLPSLVGAQLRNLFNVFDGWFGKMRDRAGEIARDIGSRISDAFNVGERHSPSILDRLKELSRTVDSYMEDIAIPDFGRQFSESIAGVALSGISASPTGYGTSVTHSPTFNVHIGMYAGSELEKRQVAKELHDALEDYQKGVGIYD